MRVAYWMKNENVEVNAAISDHEEVMRKLVELMDAGENLSNRARYEGIILDKRPYYREYTDSFNTDSFNFNDDGSTTYIRFINGVVIVATSCDGVKSPGISAITIPNGIYFPSDNVANNPARIFFSIAYPYDKSKGHIKLAYELEKILDDTDFKSALITATSAEDFINCIHDKESGNFPSAKNNSNVKRSDSSMAISLVKGQKVDLTKGNPSLTKILVGLGWKERKYDGGYDFDLDAAAFLLGANGKVNSDDDFVFYNNLKHVSGAVEHMGDELTGASEGDEGDQEQIKIVRALVPANVEKIDFTVTIYDADVRKQTFGQVSDAYIRVVDDTTGKELIRYDLGEDFSVETALVVGEIYRNKGEWKFNAIGSGWQGGLAALGKNFGVNV